LSEKGPDYTVHSIERALAILESLARRPQGLGVTELSQVLRLHKSTVHRLLSTLSAFGYVEQDSLTERYKLGRKVMLLGLEILENLDFRKEAVPYLRELVEISRETAQLAVLDGGEIVIVERDRSPEVVTVNLGLRAQVHCTAEGKVLLAYLPRDEAIYILETQGMPQHTVNTITDLEYMLSHLEKVRLQGYAINAEELVEGMRSIAAPIFDHSGKAIAALSISGPTSRLTLERIGRLVTVLKEACESISERLGYRPRLAEYQPETSSVSSFNL